MNILPTTTGSELIWMQAGEESVEPDVGRAVHDGRGFDNWSEICSVQVLGSQNCVKLGSADETWMLCSHLACSSPQMFSTHSHSQLLWRPKMFRIFFFMLINKFIWENEHLPQIKNHKYMKLKAKHTNTHIHAHTLTRTHTHWQGMKRWGGRRRIASSGSQRRGKMLCRCAADEK